MYGSDHSACIGLSNVASECCVAVLVDCSTVHFLRVMSRVCVVLLSVCNSTISVKLHNQADGGVAKKEKTKPLSSGQQT
jgi:hypothetical protein